MNALTKKLAALDDLDLSALKLKWREFYQTEAPPSMSPELLRLAIGYRLQEEVFGGVSRRTRLQLSTLRASLKANGLAQALEASPPPKSGTKLIREWQGQVHEVLTLEDGRFAYKGKTYRSLTVIAGQITGTHQSGPRFFGLNKVSSGKAMAEST